MNYSQGSVWRRWDLHVHTPGTLKNDQFEYDRPINEKADEHAELSPEKILELKWTKFYSEIEKYIGDGSDLNRAIEVIGITDYNSIENYKKVISDKKLPNSIKMVIPNIEMRLSLISGKSPVNIHFLFDPTLKPEVIEECFLGNIKFKYDDSTYSATKNGLIRLGRKIAEQEKKTLDDDGAYRLGAQQYIVDLKSLQDLFEENADLKKHVLIMAANGGEDGLSGFGKKRGDDKEESTEIQRQTSTLREAAYKFVDGLFTSNPSDVKHFLGMDGKISPSEVIQFFGSLKPCIHGSDAHCLSRLFEPDGKRYCWIKADPTFEGLKQILYEPGERVFIGPEYPEKKDAHYVIKSIKFDDENFQKDEIVFNPSLNCIIGGKSTGKSLLLRQIAKKVDPKQVSERDLSLGVEREMNIAPPRVVWGDGVESEKEIIYIPQSFLNRAIDSEPRNPIKDIIENYILQKSSIKTADNTKKNALDSLKRETRENVVRYCRSLSDLRQRKQDLLTLGSAESFQRSIADLERKRNELAESFKIDEGVYEKYELLRKEIELLSSKEKQISAEMQSLWSLSEPTVEIPDDFRYEFKDYEDVGDSVRDVYDYSSSLEFPVYGEIIQDKLRELLRDVRSKWTEFIGALGDKMSLDLSTLSSELESKMRSFVPLKTSVERNDAFEKIGEKINSEKQSLEKALDIEKSIKEIANECDYFKQSLVMTRKKYEKIHGDYCDVVNGESNDSDVGFVFSVKYFWKKDAFMEFIEQFFNNKNFSKFETLTKYDLKKLLDSQYEDELLLAIIDAMNDSNSSNSLSLKGSVVEENALMALFGDWYDESYDVTAGNDSLEFMSPGKRASVLLELLISLSANKCPILIDQPEDDLDNRSIYKDLAEYLKNKKKDRQIIIVTHNANLVVGADAEEIIIANQSGADSKNDSARFEYRTGSIENNSINSDKHGVLYASGIQSQICDILEGGKRAFEHRKQKYLSVSV